MPNVLGQDDFETEMDMEALKRADDVRKDPQRISRIQSMLQDKKEEVDKALAGFTPRSQGFNGAVRSKNGKSI